MDSDQIERRIKEIERQLSDFTASDRYIFERHLQMFDGKNIQTGRTNGTKIGTGSDQKLGFFGATPVDRPDAVPAPNSPGTVDSDARQAINRIIARLVELGLLTQE